MKLSKPLVLALELAGLAMILNGWTSEPKEGGLILFGAILAVVGAIAIADRLRGEDHRLR